MPVAPERPVITQANLMRWHGIAKILGRRRMRAARNNRMLTACTICRGTCGSGARMYGTVIIRSAQATAKRGGAEETQVSVLSGVDVGPIMKRAAGPLIVAM